MEEYPINNSAGFRIEDKKIIRKKTNKNRNIEYPLTPKKEYR